MPLNQLFYPYDTGWKPEPIYGGYLAAERDNEAGLARLMQMYDAAQQMQKQQQDYRYNEQMNPLNIQGKGLANTTAQQTLDINAPKAAKALAQVADPTWLTGELESDRLEGQTKDLKNRKQMQADVEDMAINAIDQVMSGLNKGNLSVLPSLEGLPENYKQIILESIQSGDANWNLNTLREGLLQRQAQRAYNPKKLETEAKLASAERIANIGAESRTEAARLRNEQQTKETWKRGKLIEQLITEKATSPNTWSEEKEAQLKALLSHEYTLKAMGAPSVFDLDARLGEKISPANRAGQAAEGVSGQAGATPKPKGLPKGWTEVNP